jgi:hypothetical protein
MAQLRFDTVKADARLFNISGDDCENAGFARD